MEKSSSVQINSATKHFSGKVRSLFQKNATDDLDEDLLHFFWISWLCNFYSYKGIASAHVDSTACGQAVVAKALLRTETTCLNSKCQSTTECVDPSWLVACTLDDEREDLTTVLDQFFKQKPEDWRPDASSLTRSIRRARGAGLSTLVPHFPWKFLRQFTYNNSLQPSAIPLAMQTIAKHPSLIFEFSLDFGFALQGDFFNQYQNLILSL